jgi:hypothetical protein
MEGILQHLRRGQSKPITNALVCGSAQTSLLWSEDLPLTGRDIGKLLLLQDLQEDDILVANVLDVVTAHLRHIPDISRPKVESARVPGCNIYRHASAALDEVRPFVGGWVPAVPCQR